MNPENWTWQPIDPDSGSLPVGIESALADGDSICACVVVLMDAEIDRSWGARASLAVAKSWTAAGRRVILVDACLDAPMLHEAAGFENGQGASDIALFGASIQDVVVNVGEGLHIAAAGKPVVQITDVLTHARWDKLIHGCRRVGATLVFHVATGTPGAQSLLGRAERVLVLATSSRDVAAMVESEPCRLIAVLGPSNGVSDAAAGALSSEVAEPVPVFGASSAMDIEDPLPAPIPPAENPLVEEDAGSEQETGLSEVESSGFRSDVGPESAPSEHGEVESPEIADFGVTDWSTTETSGSGSAGEPELPEPNGPWDFKEDILASAAALEVETGPAPPVPVEALAPDDELPEVAPVEVVEVEESLTSPVPVEALAPDDELPEVAPVGDVEVEESLASPVPVEALAPEEEHPEASAEDGLLGSSDGVSPELAPADAAEEASPAAPSPLGALAFEAVPGPGEVVSPTAPAEEIEQLPSPGYAESRSEVPGSEEESGSDFSGALEGVSGLEDVPGAEGPPAESESGLQDFPAPDDTPQDPAPPKIGSNSLQEASASPAPPEQEASALEVVLDGDLEDEPSDVVETSDPASLEIELTYHHREADRERDRESERATAENTDPGNSNPGVVDRRGVTERVEKRGWRILLIEDDDDYALLVHRALEKATGDRVEIRRGSTGIEGLALLRERPPDLVILDLKMPGMAGHEVLDVIKGDRALRSIPVAVLSSSDRDDDVAKSYGLGGNHYITKPRNPMELEAKLGSLLRNLGDLHGLRRGAEGAATTAASAVSPDSMTALSVLRWGLVVGALIALYVFGRISGVF